MYEKLKTHVPEEHKRSILTRLSCGAFAGLFGQTLTYPLDVVKRQMQVQLKCLLFFSCIDLDARGLMLLTFKAFSICFGIPFSVNLDF